jgi:hypothetical protein
VKIDASAVPGASRLIYPKLSNPLTPADPQRLFSLSHEQPSSGRFFVVLLRLVSASVFFGVYFSVDVAGRESAIANTSSGQRQIKFRQADGAIGDIRPPARRSRSLLRQAPRRIGAGSQLVPVAQLSVPRKAW